ncbi:MAG: hypothetical protein IPK50_03940 [Fibrobacterota bacterium]|nr:hypothetical protein [Fibrobacterota bacterium]QQS06045.1 MAG: hypothetical protein IPK50_03940 [Fibrobacterota bacterium]
MKRPKSAAALEMAKWLSSLKPPPPWSCMLGPMDWNFRSLRRSAPSFGYWVVLMGSAAHAGGACCVVQVAGSEQPRIAVSGVHAQSHETVFGSARSFSQQGVVLRLSWPVALGFGVSGTAGVPVRTDLEGIGAGLGGWIAGAGASWSHRLWDSDWSTGASMSGSRSEARLEGSSGWILSELQGAVHLERALNPTRSVHVGIRMNLGRTDLEHEGQSMRVESDAHPTGFVGWNEAWSSRVATILEAGYGHGFLVSVGAAFPFR